MGIVTEIFDVLSMIVMSVTTMFQDLFGAVLKIFWTDAGDGGQLTVLGTLALIGLGIGLFMFAFRMILRFVKMRG